MKVFLDVNVFMYAAGRPHPHKEPCVRLMRRIAEGEVDAVSDAEALQEILYRYWHLKLLEQGVALLGQVVEAVPTWLPVSKEDMLLAKELLAGQDRLSPRDAVHAAVMLNNGIRRVYTYDRHFDLVEGLERVEPQ